MMYKIFLIELLGIFLFESCYDDKGNYSYRAINEITVKHDFFGDTMLRMYSFVDTLRVFPEISTTVNHDPDNYEYEWVAVGGDPTIGDNIRWEKRRIWFIRLLCLPRAMLFILKFRISPRD